MLLLLRCVSTGYSLLDHRINEDKFEEFGIDSVGKTLALYKQN
jgi:hypothetical protein